MAMSTQIVGESWISRMLYSDGASTSDTLDLLRISGQEFNIWVSLVILPLATDSFRVYLRLNWYSIGFTISGLCPKGSMKPLHRWKIYFSGLQRGACALLMDMIRPDTNDPSWKGLHSSARTLRPFDSPTPPLSVTPASYSGHSTPTWKFSEETRLSAGLTAKCDSPMSRSLSVKMALYSRK